MNIEHGQADDDELEEQLTSMLKTKRVTSGQKKERMTEKVQDKVAAAKAKAAQLESLINVQAPAPEKDATSRAAEAVMRVSLLCSTRFSIFRLGSCHSAIRSNTRDESSSSSKQIK